jgi:large subunit ribosomal protein L32
MACPKKKTGSSAQGHRRSKWKATLPTITKCKNCNDMAYSHTVCACGYYAGKLVSKKLEK